jgi:hypothetical protein
MRPTEWITVEKSTLIEAIAYDGAAERIYVRLHSGEEWYFDDCDTHLWERFKSPAMSKGEFLTNVLENHKHTRVRP